MADYTRTTLSWPSFSYMTEVRGRMQFMQIGSGIDNVQAKDTRAKQALRPKVNPRL